MRTKVVATMLAIGFVLVSSVAVIAQDPIQSLRISTTPDGSKAGYLFPAGTQSLFAVFTYSDLSDHRVSVTVEGRGVPQLASTSTRLTGSGLGSLEISGANVYKSVSSRLLGEAEAARDNVNRAANATVGLQEYLQQVLASAYTMRALTEYLAEVPISEPLTKHTATVRRAAAELEVLADDALRLPVSDVAGRQAKVEAMKRPVSTLVTSGRLIDEGAASITVAPIAPSPNGLDYTAQVSINSLPSASVEFRISADTRAFIPVVAKRFAFEAAPRSLSE